MVLLHLLHRSFNLTKNGDGVRIAALLFQRILPILPTTVPILKWYSTVYRTDILKC